MGAVSSLISNIGRSKGSTNTEKFINQQIKSSKNSLYDSNIFTEIKKNKQEKNYEYIVFSGGGLKGISYCGVVNVLDKLGILFDKEGQSKIKGYAGTSIGSLFAGILAIGYKTDDLNDILKSLDVTKFFDSKLKIIEDMALIFENYGLCNGDYIETFLGDLIQKKNRRCRLYY